MLVFFFQAEDGIRDLVRSRGLGDVYKRQGYLVNLLAGIGIIIPEWLCTPPFNVPALIIVAILSLIHI